MPSRDYYIIRPRGVCKLLGMARSTLYLKISRGDFTLPFRLSKLPDKRSAVGWLHSDVLNWLEQCANSKDEAISHEQ
jgi:predicted DNA-binding transcriptional regulator AlpA